MEMKAKDYLKKVCEERLDAGVELDRLYCHMFFSLNCYPHYYSYVFNLHDVNENETGYTYIVYYKYPGGKLFEVSEKDYLSYKECVKAARKAFDEFPYKYLVKENKN